MRANKRSRVFLKYISERWKSRYWLILIPRDPLSPTMTTIAFSRPRWKVLFSRSRRLHRDRKLQGQR